MRTIELGRGKKVLPIKIKVTKQEEIPCEPDTPSGPEAKPRIVTILKKDLDTLREHRDLKREINEFMHTEEELKKALDMNASLAEEKEALEIRLKEMEKKETLKTGVSKVKKALLKSVGRGTEAGQKEQLRSVSLKF